MIEHSQTFIKHFKGASGNPAAMALSGMIERSEQDKKLELSNFAHDRLIDPDTQANSLLNGLFVSSPLHGLSHHIRMDAVHAVEKPLMAPDINKLWVFHEQPKARASAPEGSKNEPENEMLQAWRDFIDKNNITALSDLSDDLRLSGIEGSQRVMFGGSIQFHRRSSSTLELNGTWYDYNKDLRPRPVRGEFHLVPELKMLKLETRNQLENIPYEIDDELAPGLFDLVHSPIGEKRILYHEFAGTHAKRIDFSATAISRFAKYFREKEKPDVRAIGTDAWRIIIPATRRPDKVILSAVSSALHESGGRILDISGTVAGETLLPLVRKIMIRLDLGTSWYSSGEGERLGIVLWPPDLSEVPSAHRKAVTINVDQIPEFATCWGRDPVRLTGDIPRLLYASSIANCTSYVRSLVPVPPEGLRYEDHGAPSADDTTKPQFVECALALFEPLVDPDTGHFYTDIEIDTGNSYNAFVRLGLVRYQSDCLRFTAPNPYNLEVSVPIPTQISVMPGRKLGCRVGENAGIILNYSGIGYSEMSAKSLELSGEDTPPWQSAVDKLQTTTVDVILLWRTRDREYSGVPVGERSTLNGEFWLAEIVDMPPTVAGPGFLHEWEFQVDIVQQGETCSKCREREQLIVELPTGPGNLEIVIREYEHYLADALAESESYSNTTDSPFPAEFNTRVIKRVVSSFTVDVEAGVIQNNESK